MGFYDALPGYKAGGTIAPSTFVKLSTTSKTVLQSGSNERTIGISQAGPDAFQDADNALNPAATVGESIMFFKHGEPCSLLLGTGGCTAGDFLKSDSAGAGVVGYIGQDNIGAIALEAGVATDYVLVMPFPNYDVRTITDVTASTTLTRAAVQSRVLVTLLTSATITLPPTSTLQQGDEFWVVSKTAPTSGAGVLVEPNGADTAYLYTGGVTATYVNNKGMLNTQATARAGDSLRVIFDGVNFLCLATGTWAKEA